MPKYSVPVTRTTIEEAEVVVEADDVDEAEQKAEEEARKLGANLDWNFLDEDFEISGAAEEEEEESEE